jgi:hypothetical protein
MCSCVDEGDRSLVKIRPAGAASVVTGVRAALKISLLPFLGGLE